MLKKPISADSHITEPPNCYIDHIDPKFRDRAPHMKRLDKVAYVRFASVYRHFRDIGEFMSELKELLKEKSGKGPGDPKDSIIHPLTLIQEKKEK